MSPNRASLAIASLLLAAGVAAAPARAQLVPKFVDYPVAPQAAACTAVAPDAPYAKRESGHQIRLYGDRNCSDKTLLYTVDGPKVTITALGATMLAQLCDARLPGFEATCEGQQLAQ